MYTKNQFLNTFTPLIAVLLIYQLLVSSLVIMFSQSELLPISGGIKDAVIVDYLLITLCLGLRNTVPGLVFKSAFLVLIFLKCNALIYYGDTLSLGAFLSIIESNSVEALGFLSSFGYQKLGLTTAFTTVMAWLLFHPRLYQKHYPRLAAFLVLTLVVVLSLRLMRKPRKYSEFLAQPLVYLSETYQQSLFNPIVHYVRYQKELSLRQANQRKTLPSFITSVSAPHYQHIILILGESASRSHYQSYGYAHATTPNMMRWLKNSKFQQIEQVISPAPFTREALKRVLSFATVSTDMPYYQNIHLVDAAKLQGYETYWLSSNPKHGLHDTEISRIATASDQSVFALQDTMLAKQVSDRIQADRRQFFTIHLHGSHGPYENFSSQQLEIMQAASSATPEYDATVLRTDQVIHDTMEIARRLPNSLVVYLSDHGEDVGIGHGAPNFTKPQYEVPMFVYSSTETPNIALLDRLRVNNIFNSENFIFYMFDQMGFEFDVDQVKGETLQVLGHTLKQLNYLSQ
jgi:glucan phosphoethanolaminetransferase (alkaline phosphatase superfamily)